MRRSEMRSVIQSANLPSTSPYHGARVGRVGLGLAAADQPAENPVNAYAAATAVLSGRAGETRRRALASARLISPG